MQVFEIHPLQDPRWASFTAYHPNASVFHTAEWIAALQRTYKYTPVVFTTNAPRESLTAAIVCCRVDSWLTGSRFVSLPFSDHCEPLVETPNDLPAMLAAIAGKMVGRIRYAELRPRGIEITRPVDWRASARYCFHALDLQPSLGEIESRLHKDSIRRKIRRAERERVVIEKGTSDVLLNQFYRLTLLTRRRHGVPPQPFSWFQNLIASFGPRLSIRVASVDGQPIASILTLRHQQTLVYKYGGSDAKFHNLGGMPLLFWQAIREAKEEGVKEFDLGRSDLDNQGLIQFKDHLGATKTALSYWRFSTRAGAPQRHTSPLVETVLTHLPDRLFRLAGEFFYRHAG